MIDANRAKYAQAARTPCGGADGDAVPQFRAETPAVR